jgi:hypothetical protein
MDRIDGTTHWPRLLRLGATGEAATPAANDPTRGAPARKNRGAFGALARGGRTRRTFGRSPDEARWVLAVALLVAAACADDPTTPPRAPAPATSAVRADAAAEAQLPALRELAQLVALGMREPTARAAFRHASAGSPVKEGKLHLATFLRSPHGKPLLIALSRAAGERPGGGPKSESQVLALLDALPALELYLPVDAHRDRWQGESDVLVAAQLGESGEVIGFDVTGSPVAIDERVAPTTPTVAIVPAESFEPSGQPRRRDVVRGTDAGGGAGPAVRSADATTAPSAVAAAQVYEGIWITEIHIPNESRYEPWYRGDPEYEMRIERSNTTPRAAMVCTGAQSIEPYAWNMDGTDYYSDWLQAQSYELGTNVPFVLSVWEDDDTPCKVVQDKDYVKLAADAIKNALGVYKAIKTKQFQNGEWVVNLLRAGASTLAILRSEDDFVGVSAGTAGITSTPHRFELKDEYMQNRGWFVARWSRRTI